MRGGASDVRADFQSAATIPKRKRTGSPIFKMRLTAEERARLERDAGDTPLATYIKFRLLNGLPDLASLRPALPCGRPATDTQLIAQLLAVLGQSHLANNLNQLAKAANMGTLEVRPETEQELLDACAAVKAMRQDLISALGLKGSNRR